MGRGTGGSQFVHLSHALRVLTVKVLGGVGVDGDEILEPSYTLSTCIYTYTVQGWSICMTAKE